MPHAALSGRAGRRHEIRLTRIRCRTGRGQSIGRRVAAIANQVERRLVGRSLDPASAESGWISDRKLDARLFLGRPCHRAARNVGSAHADDVVPLRWPWQNLKKRMGEL